MLPIVLPQRKFYNEQMFVLVHMQLQNHADTRLEKRFKQ